MAVSRYGTLTNATAALHLANCSGARPYTRGSMVEEKLSRDDLRDGGRRSFSVTTPDDSTATPVAGKHRREQRSLRLFISESFNAAAVLLMRFDVARRPVPLQNVSGTHHARYASIPAGNL